MAEGMFGAPVGWSQAGRDSDAAVMNALTAAGKLEDIADRPVERALKQSHARLYNAQAGAAEHTLAATQRWTAAISQMGQGLDALEHIDQIGLEAYRAGLPEEGRKTLNTTSQIRLRAQQELTSAATAARQEALAIRDRALLLGNLAAPVIDQVSLNQALMMGASQGVDISKMPKVYNEQTAPFFRQLEETAIGAAKRAELQLKEIDIESRNAGRNSRLQNDSATRELREVQKRLAEARIRRLDREGGGAGGTVGSPSKDDVARARRLLKDSGLDLSGDDLKLAGDAVAARAKALVKATRGLDIEEATRRAIAKAQEEGDFPVNAGLPIIGNALGNKHKFSGAGRTPHAPLPPPTKGTKDGLPIPDVSKMIEGKFYRAPNGEVFQWKGGKPERVVQGLVGPIALAEDDDDDDEDLA